MHNWSFFTCMLNSTTGPVFPMPMHPPMMTISSIGMTSGYKTSSSAAFVRGPVHTSLEAALKSCLLVFRVG